MERIAWFLSTVAVLIVAWWLVGVDAPPPSDILLQTARDRVAVTCLGECGGLVDGDEVIYVAGAQAAGRFLVQEAARVVVLRGSEAVIVEYKRPSPTRVDAMALVIPRVISILLLLPNVVLALAPWKRPSLVRAYYLLSFPAVLVVTGYMGSLMLMSASPLHSATFTLAAFVAMPLSVGFFGRALSARAECAAPAAALAACILSIVTAAGLLVFKDASIMFVFLGVYVLIMALVVHRTVSNHGLATHWRALGWAMLPWVMVTILPLAFNMAAGWWANALLILPAAISAPPGILYSVFGNKLPGRLRRYLYHVLPALVLGMLFAQFVAVASAFALPSLRLLGASGYALVSALSTTGAAVLLSLARAPGWALRLFYGAPSGSGALLRELGDTAVLAAEQPRLAQIARRLLVVDELALYVADANGRLGLLQSVGVRQVFAPADVIADVSVPVYRNRALIGAIAIRGESPVADDTVFDDVLDALRAAVGILATQRELDDACRRCAAAQVAEYRRGSIDAAHRVIGNVSHFLATPLALALARHGETPELRQMARALDTVRQIAQPIVEHARSRTAVNGLVLEAVNEALLDTPDVEPHLHLPALPAAAVPDMRLRQVLVAVLQNAAEATTGMPGAAVRVSGYTAGGCIHIQVADNGPGIPADMLPVVQEPYITTKNGRDGMGLALATGIMHRYGGGIHIESDGPGTTVTIMLPMAEGEMDD